MHNSSTGLGWDLLRIINDDSWNVSPQNEEMGGVVGEPSFETVSLSHTHTHMHARTHAHTHTTLTDAHTLPRSTYSSVLCSWPNKWREEKIRQESVNKLCIGSWTQTREEIYMLTSIPITCLPPSSKQLLTNSFQGNQLLPKWLIHGKPHQNARYPHF